MLLVTILIMLVLYIKFGLIDIVVSIYLILVNKKFSVIREPKNFAHKTVLFSLIICLASICLVLLKIVKQESKRF